MGERKISDIWRPRSVNARTVMAPVAAFLMAGVLLVYARSSIRAARIYAATRDEDTPRSGGLG